MSAATRARVTWAVRYVNLAVLFLGISIAAAWVVTSYAHFGLGELLIFRSDDGWCVQGSQSVFMHCFGDYAIVDEWSTEGLWNPESGVATAYPALAWVPALLAMWVGDAVGDWNVGRNLFLVAISASILSPAIWVAWRERSRGLPALALIGFGSAPFLMAVDRGNSVGFLVLPILVASLAFARGNYRLLATAVVVASLIRPQMLLLLLLLLVVRRLALFIAAVAATGLITVLGFALYPGGIQENFENWITVLINYNDYQSISEPYPYNLGFGRSILTSLQLLRIDQLLGEQTWTTMASLVDRGSLVLGAGLVVVVAAVLFRFGCRPTGPQGVAAVVALLTLTMLVPGTTYAYYLVVLLVPAALVLANPRSSGQGGTTSGGMLDGDVVGRGRITTATKWTLVFVLAVLMAPLALPVSLVVPIVNEALLTHPAASLPQLLAGPLLIVLLVASLALMLSSSKDVTRSVATDSRY